MALTKKNNIDFFGFFNIENKALGSFKSASGVYFKVSCGSIELMHHGSFDGASNEPWCTLNWTTTHFEMNHNALWNKPQKHFEMNTGPYF